MPEITIYVTNYNYGQYLEKCLDSVLNQTYKDFELIIIDDGSTDNSVQIINKYWDYATHVMLQKNQGLIKTNNNAIHLAQGKFIMRVDADDYLREDAVEKLHNEIVRQQDAVLVFPDYYIVDENDSILSQYIRHNFKKDVTLFDMPAHGACTLIDIEYIKKIGGYDERHTRQDGYDLWLKVIRDKKKVANVNEPLFYYRQHGNNLTKNELSLYQARCAIKSNYYPTRKRTVCIIPYHQLPAIKQPFGLEKIGNNNIISLIVDTVKSSNVIDEVYLATSHKEVIKYAKEAYGDELNYVLRDRESSSQSYRNAIIDILSERDDIEYVIIIEPEYPFLKPNYIDELVYTLEIFDVDFVDSVRIEKDNFYYHDGSGMMPLRRNSRLRYEREDLYRRTGGLSAYRAKSYGQELETLKNGHIMIDEISAFKVDSEINLMLARALYEAHFS